MSQKKEETSVKSTVKATEKKAIKSSKKKPAVMKVAPDHHTFVTLDGKRLESILELAHELDNMADHVFYHHVNNEKNDFSNWIRDVSNEITLAQKIAEAKDKHNTHIIVLRHIVNELPEK